MKIKALHPIFLAGASISAATHHRTLEPLTKLYKMSPTEQRTAQRGKRLMTLCTPLGADPPPPPWRPPGHAPCPAPAGAPQAPPRRCAAGGQHRREPPRPPCQGHARSRRAARRLAAPLPARRGMGPRVVPPRRRLAPTARDQARGAAAWSGARSRGGPWGQTPGGGPSRQRRQRVSPALPPLSWGRRSPGRQTAGHSVDLSTPPGAGGAVGPRGAWAAQEVTGEPSAPRVHGGQVVWPCTYKTAKRGLVRIS